MHIRSLAITKATTALNAFRVIVSSGNIATGVVR
jgi:hypothetical protein